MTEPITPQPCPVPCPHCGGTIFHRGFSVFAGFLYDGPGRYTPTITECPSDAMVCAACGQRVTSAKALAMESITRRAEAFFAELDAREQQARQDREKRAQEERERLAAEEVERVRQKAEAERQRKAEWERGAPAREAAEQGENARLRKQEAEQRQRALTVERGVLVSDPSTAFTTDN